MSQKTIRIEGILLTEHAAIVIPCLSIIGAASIISALGYGVYKLGKKVYDEKNKLNKSIKEISEFMKENKES